jgi:amidohydrolase
MNIRNEIQGLMNRALTIRRALHAIPEEGYKEVKTREKIQEVLRDLGYETQPMAQTGLCCLIPGENTEKTIAFRADMDGLSIAEQTNVDYASTHHQMMHACGHDGHMTMLLLLATYLKEQKTQPVCNVLLIFQPAEEGPGGAKVMVEEGLFTRYNVDEVYGCHIMPDLHEGWIATRKGPMMAQTGELYVEVVGKSAHGAAPHQGLDAILAASQFVMALQSIVSRNIDPLKTSLITIGTIQGGERVNVIAGAVSLGGTMRAYEESVYDHMKKRVMDTAEGVGMTTGCQIKVRFVDMYPPVVNDDQLFENFTGLLDDDEWQEAQPLMIAEDFSFYQKQVPGLFFYLGGRNIEKGYVHGLHDSRFNFDESILLHGVEVYARILDKEEHR